MFKNVTGCSVIIAAMLFAMACSTSIKTGPLSRITITPEKGRVYVGQSINLAARGYDDKGNMIKVSPNWRIINSKTGVLNKSDGDNVSFTGKFYGVNRIVAEYKGVKGNAVVEVVKSNTSWGK
ncbi:MAG TPA: hypothetical protein PKN50_01400 [Spirochaetota bacterium]|nr:hypothetical protein [Spirochaetota bacterium]HPV42171.1 hypothetical protein [Spirochaetota bacterium]